MSERDIMTEIDEAARLLDAPIYTNPLDELRHVCEQRRITAKRARRYEQAATLAWVIAQIDAYRTNSTTEPVTPEPKSAST